MPDFFAGDLVAAPNPNYFFASASPELQSVLGDAAHESVVTYRCITEVLRDSVYVTFASTTCGFTFQMFTSGTSKVCVQFMHPVPVRWYRLNSVTDTRHFIERLRTLLVAKVSARGPGNYAPSASYAFSMLSPAASSSRKNRTPDVRGRSLPVKKSKGEVTQTQLDVIQNTLVPYFTDQRCTYKAASMPVTGDPCVKFEWNRADGKKGSFHFTVQDNGVINLFTSSPRCLLHFLNAATCLNFVRQRADDAVSVMPADD
jgi:hypothetical protein